MPVIQNVRMHSNFLWPPQVTIEQDAAQAEPALSPRKPGSTWKALRCWGRPLVTSAFLCGSEYFCVSLVFSVRCGSTILGSLLFKRLRDGSNLTGVFLECFLKKSLGIAGMFLIPGLKQGDL